MNSIISALRSDFETPGFTILDPLDYSCHPQNIRRVEICPCRRSMYGVSSYICPPPNYPNHALNIWDIKAIESHVWNLIFDPVSIHTTKTLGVHLPDLGNESLDFQRSKITFRHLGGGNSTIFYVHPYLGKWSNLANIFGMGWNHHLGMIQLDNVFGNWLKPPTIANVDWNPALYGWSSPMAVEITN